jgi:membrane-bound inhibitor of C-type lysozyme
VEYVNDEVNGLAIVPIAGHSVIFSNVLSDAGLRFESGVYVWQESSQQGVSLGVKSYGKMRRYSCHRLSPVVR